MLCVCMYVCMYIYIYIYIHTYVQMCMYTYTPIYNCIYTYTFGKPPNQSGATIRSARSLNEELLAPREHSKPLCDPHP